MSLEITSIKAYSDSVNSIDEKALSILKSYNFLKPTSISEDDFEYAKKAGLMFEAAMQTHESAQEEVFKELSICNKKNITDLFLASLSSNRLDWRIGLPVYAIMQTFPMHIFEPASSELLNQCSLCCSNPREILQLSFFSQIRFFVGGAVCCDIYEYAFVLKQNNLLHLVKPEQKDFAIFSNILYILKNADTKDTPSKLLKKLKVKGFKANEEQKKALLDTLGYCSILETKEHKGFLTKYTNLGVTPRKSRSSDFHYPVDWWTGADGINTTAFKFWFENYPELEKFWK